MPVKRIESEPVTYKEAVDYVATDMKEAHKPYGQYAKRLADLVHEVVRPAKGMWQPWWTIAARVFGLAYSGHNENVLKGCASLLAEEMGLDTEKAEELAEAINENMARITGEKAKRQGGRRYLI